MIKKNKTYNDLMLTFYGIIIVLFSAFSFLIQQTYPTFSGEKSSSIDDSKELCSLKINRKNYENTKSKFRKFAIFNNIISERKAYNFQFI